MLDEIDLDLLEQCAQNPGQPLVNAIRPLLKERGTRTLYDRMFALEVQQFVAVNRCEKKGQALATITEKGRVAIKGRRRAIPKDGDLLG